MWLVTMEKLNVHIGSGTVGEGLEKFPDKDDVEIADKGLASRNPVGKVGTPPKIHDKAAEALVHWKQEKAVSSNAGLVPKSRFQGLPEDDANILDRVVVIHREVSLSLELELKKPVTGEKLKHVVKKRNTRGYVRLSRPVQAQRKLNPGFSGLAA